MKSTPIKSKYSYEVFPVSQKNRKKPYLIILAALLVIGAGSFFAIKQLAFGNTEIKTNNAKSNVAEYDTRQAGHGTGQGEPRVSDKFELPVVGASGFASVNMSVKKDRDENSKTVESLKAGDGFRILRERGRWWKIKTDSAKGWVSNRYCMINLPDIIPSIIYDNTNSYSSVFMSSGKDIPGLTGKKLYDAITQNRRFNEKLPIMPVIYSMSHKIYKAQKAALNNDEAIVLVESYRPYETQRKVVDCLSAFIDSDSEVNKGINKSPWSKSWFISTGRSNHQRGTAIDITLAKIQESKSVPVGEYEYYKIAKYTEYKMPSPIHELSTRAVSFSRPFKSMTSEWKNVSPSENMNEEALRLQKYCTDAGLTPLASEWWHFDDPGSFEQISDNKSEGGYFITKCYSF